MRTLFFALLTLLPFVARGQQIEVYRSDGTYRTYRPEHQRTIVKHDTVTLVERIRDTTSIHDQTITREIYRIDTGRVSLNILLQQAAPNPLVVERKRTTFGVFGYADLHGTTVAPALSVDLLSIRFWIYSGVFYTSETHKTSLSVGVSAFAPLFEHSWAP